MTASHIPIQKSSSNTSRPYSFLPLYIMSHLKTFSVGMMTTATSNHLLIEKNLDAGLASFIVGLYSAGFFLSALLVGRIADKYGETAVLRYSAWLSILFGIATLVPITNSLTLLLFSFARFGDGITNGIFWPTVQKFSIYAERCGPEIKKNYLMGYNLSWNTGALFSMILGVIIVFFTTSNYTLFYINTLGAFVVLILGYTWFQPLPPISAQCDSPGLSVNDNSSSSSTPIIHSFMDRQLIVIPTVSTLMILLIHSLTDGAISIMIPLKINLLGYSSYWVFVIALLKSLMQTGASGYMAKMNSKYLLSVLYSMVLAMPFLWLMFPLLPSIEWMFVLAIFSGFCQGSIYALGMALISLKAQQQNSARPYTFFQATMSGGRMTGPWLVGLFLAGNLVYGGLYLIIAYSFFAWFQFYFKSRRKSVLI